VSEVVPVARSLLVERSPLGEACRRGAWVDFDGLALAVAAAAGDAFVIGDAAVAGDALVAGDAFGELPGEAARLASVEYPCVAGEAAVLAL